MRGGCLALVLASVVSIATGSCSGANSHRKGARSITPDRIPGGAERRAARRQRLRVQ